MDDTFTAQGGETQIYIGSFRPEAEKEVTVVGVNSNPEFEYAYFYIDDVEVYLDEPVGMDDDVQSTLEVSVYPNPTTERITVSLGTAATQANTTTLIVTDMLGRRIEVLPTVQGDGWVMDVSAWPAGLYLLQATTPDGRTAVQKLMKNP